MAYPISVRVQPDLDRRGRGKVLFRGILAFPHLILVGTVVGVASIGARTPAPSEGATKALLVLAIIGMLTIGILNVAVLLTSVVSWFVVMVTGKMPVRLWEFARFVVTWQTRSTAYLYLLRDDYPPFGKGDYSVNLLVKPPSEKRSRLKVGLRGIITIPQWIISGLLGCVWTLTTFVAWLGILITGRYPERLYGFGVGVLQWTARVKAYSILLTDEHPPFSLAHDNHPDPEATTGELRRAA